MTIIYAILIFCLLIFVHEFGHFIAAKACGVKVNEFAIGMGPAFFKKQKGETQYSLRIFPIGGFCAVGWKGKMKTRKMNGLLIISLPGREHVYLRQDLL